MAVLTKEQLLDKLKAKLGEDTSDEALALIEDVTDTCTDYENKGKDTTDWKKKYEDNDKNWRQKYRDRFFSAKKDDDKGGDGDDDDDDNGDDKKEPLTYDNLFKEGTK